MKKIVYLIFAICTLMACDKSSTSPSYEQPKDDNIADIYYVRYCFDEGGSGGRYNISYTREDGKRTNLSNIVPGEHFERTVGPVNLGFKATLTVTSTSGSNNPNARIEIKKNDSPFLVKIEGNSSYGLSYTIE